MVSTVVICLFTVFAMGLSVYSMADTRRERRTRIAESAERELRFLAEQRRALNEVRGLRAELEDALSEVAGKLSLAGIDVPAVAPDPDPEGTRDTDPGMPPISERSKIRRIGPVAT